MKVTVCFGEIRVVVPCGDGDNPVRDLIVAALARYKKASNKEVSIRVESLKNSGGAILDDEDRIRDVIEDRDQIFAVFEELPNVSVQGQGHSNSVTYGDNTATVADTSSNIARSINNTGDELETEPPVHSNNDIHVDSSAVVSIAEDGTEESKILALTHSESQLVDSVVNNSNEKENEGDRKDLRTSKSLQEGLDSRGTKSGRFLKSFVRDVSRKSLGNTLSASTWFDAQERVLLRNETTPANRYSAGFELYTDLADMTEGEMYGGEPQAATGSEEISTTNKYRIFDFCLSPPSGKDFELTGISYSTSDSPANSPAPIYHSSPKPPPRTLSKRKKYPENLPPSPIVRYTVSPNPEWSEARTELTPVVVKKSESNTTHHVSLGVSSSFVAKMSPEATVVEESVVCVPSSASVGPSHAPCKGIFLAPTNTRLLGNKICIELMKGSSGLGFSITTRDNLAGNDCPIYIKNILPKGAAVEDGRLKAGDRLLLVNGNEMTGKSQSDAARILREVPIGGRANLVISRQGDDGSSCATSGEQKQAEILAATPASSSEQAETESVKAEAENSCVSKPLCDDEICNEAKALPGETLQAKSLTVDPAVSVVNRSDKETVEKYDGDVVDGESRYNSLRKAKNTNNISEYLNDMDILTFNIALGESGPAGLGITVQRVSERGQDLGICIKSVIGGGAVSKDGRIKVNDHLVEINGITLSGIDNAKAIDILKTAMQSNGKISGFFTVKVARRKVQRRFSTQSAVQREARVSAHLSRLLDSDILASLSLLGDSTGKVCSRSANSSKSVETLAAYEEKSPLDTSSSPVADSETECRTSSVDWEPDGNVSSTSVDVDPIDRTDQLVGKHLEGREALDENNSDFITVDISNEDLESAFSREACGRQSISEKRKAHFDPRTIEFYQKLKGDKETQYSSVTWDPRKSSYNRSAVSKPTDLRRMIAMKKCKSLESLHTLSSLGESLTVVDEICCTIPADDSSDALSPVAPSRRDKLRPCGGNDSFKAAVDHSYEPGSSHDIMETVEEDQGEVDIGGSTIIPGSSSSRASSQRRFSYRAKPSSPDSKSPWSLKSLADMFRTSKHHRNTEANVTHKNNQNEKISLKATETSTTSGAHIKLDETPRSSKYGLAELKRFAERLRVKDNGLTKSESPNNSSGHVPTSSAEDYEMGPGRMVKVKPADLGRMQRLREDHQRQHRERQGQYPLDTREDLIERQIREYEKSHGLQSSPRTPEHKAGSFRSASAKLSARRLSDRFKGLSNVFSSNNHERQRSNPERKRRNNLPVYNEVQGHEVPEATPENNVYSARSSVDSQISNGSLSVKNSLSEPCNVFDEDAEALPCESVPLFYSVQQISSPTNELTYCYSSLPASSYKHSYQRAFDATPHSLQRVGLGEFDYRAEGVPENFSSSDAIVFDPETRYETQYESLPLRHDLKNRYANISRSAQV